MCVVALCGTKVDAVPLVVLFLESFINFIRTGQKGVHGPLPLIYASLSSATDTHAVDIDNWPYIVIACFYKRYMLASSFPSTKPPCTYGTFLLEHAPVFVLGIHRDLTRSIYGELWLQSG